MAADLAGSRAAAKVGIAVEKSVCHWVDPTAVPKAARMDTLWEPRLGLTTVDWRACYQAAEMDILTVATMVDSLVERKVS